MKKRLALVLSGAIVLTLLALSMAPGPIDGSPTPEYQVAPVERGAILSTVTASGILDAVDVVEVGSQLSGRIVAVEADHNSVVKKGDVIARLDPEEFEALVDEAKADVAIALAEEKAARVQWEETQRELVRLEALGEQNAVSDRELDKARANFSSAEAALDLAKARVEQRRAGLSRNQFNLDRSVIRAPIDGVVIERGVNVGQTVAASLQAPTLFTVARDLRNMQVETSVDEADVGRVKAGQRASFTVDSFPGRVFTGKVVQVRKAPQVVQNVVTYTVIISAYNDGRHLLPGMTANVSIVVSEKNDVLKVPNAALRFAPTGTDGVPVVTALATAETEASLATAVDQVPGRVWAIGKDGTPKPVPVLAGASDGLATEVVAGKIKVGTPVIVGYRDSTER